MMWLWWVRMPYGDLTYVTLVSKDAFWRIDSCDCYNIQKSDDLWRFACGDIYDNMYGDICGGDDDKIFIEALLRNLSTNADLDAMLCWPPKDYHHCHRNHHHFHRLKMMIVTVTVTTIAIVIPIIYRTRQQSTGLNSAMKREKMKRQGRMKT